MKIPFGKIFELDGIKSKLAKIAFQRVACWRVLRRYKIQFGPNYFPKRPQKDFIQTPKAQIDPNSFRKRMPTGWDKIQFGQDRLLKGCLLEGVEKV